MNQVGVIGAGAFGTALASVMALGGNHVTLWGRDATTMAKINKSRKHSRYLPDIALPDTLKATGALAELEASDVILMAVPAQTTRDVLKRLQFENSQCPILMCAKGIELKTSLKQSDILLQSFPDRPWGVISGPGFAAEIASGKPTALTLATDNPALGEHLQTLLSTPTLRMYLSGDPNGVQLGGALKNVYAIACGIVRGAGLGESAQAALLTRGFAELRELASTMGAKSETLSGLSGFGDLVLSCTSKQSRNYAFGYQIGSHAEFGQTNTVEGIATAQAVDTLAKQHSVDMPICHAVSSVLQQKLSISDALKQLMTRPLKREV